MQKTYYDPADLKKFGKISDWNEELGKKFFDYYGKVFEEGALSEREKSLIALAVAHTTGNYQGRNDGGSSCGCCNSWWCITSSWRSNDE